MTRELRRPIGDVSAWPPALVKRVRCVSTAGGERRIEWRNGSNIGMTARSTWRSKPSWSPIRRAAGPQQRFLERFDRQVPILAFRVRVAVLLQELAAARSAA